MKFLVLLLSILSQEFEFSPREILQSFVHAVWGKLKKVFTEGIPQPDSQSLGNVEYESKPQTQKAKKTKKGSTPQKYELPPVECFISQVQPPNSLETSIRQQLSKELERNYLEAVAHSLDYPVLPQNWQKEPLSQLKKYCDRLNYRKPKTIKNYRKANSTQNLIAKLSVAYKLT